VLQFFFDEERKVLPFDPFDDFALLTEEEYSLCERAKEYEHFVHEFREQYIYEMMRLNREATPFETLGHIAGVHHVAMTVARGLHKAGVPIDLALASGAAAGHDLGKFVDLEPRGFAFPASNSPLVLATVLNAVMPLHAGILFVRGVFLK
jgi:hypothetical protein